jgi:hypothetical protein
LDKKNNDKRGHEPIIYLDMPRIDRCGTADDGYIPMIETQPCREVGPTRITSHWTKRTKYCPIIDLMILLGFQDAMTRGPMARQKDHEERWKDDIYLYIYR